jgi:hypothetical protein
MQFQQVSLPQRNAKNARIRAYAVLSLRSLCSLAANESLGCGNAARAFWRLEFIADGLPLFSWFCTHLFGWITWIGLDWLGLTWMARGVVWGKTRLHPVTARPYVPYRHA